MLENWLKRKLVSKDRLLLRLVEQSTRDRQNFLVRWTVMSVGPAVVTQFGGVLLSM